MNEDINDVLIHMTTCNVKKKSHTYPPHRLYVDSELETISLNDKIQRVWSVSIELLRVLYLRKYVDDEEKDEDEDEDIYDD